MSQSFIHLSVHSEFSLVDSMVRVKPLVAACENSMPAIAITDRHNLFALVKFYKAAHGAGIKPIAGSELIIEGEGEEEPFRALFLVMNPVGYNNLTQLISRGYQEGQGSGSPRVERAWVEAAAEGLIMLSGGINGDVGQAVSRGREADAEELAKHWKGVFGDRFYFALTRTNKPGEEAYIRSACEFSARHSIPVVAVNDVCFLNESDFTAHEARLCVQGGYVLADPKRPVTVTDQQYLKSTESMVELFSDIPSAIENSVEIAKRCSVTLELGTPVLPDFPIPEGMTESEYFIQISEEGLNVRLAQLYDTTADDFAATRQPYDERLKFELDVIVQMGFPGYFLIVADFIQWSRENDIPVGPGRGSGAGSLVAYALTITDLDPLAYDLLFERFLNPERVSMPDFDIDFCMDGRDRVIQYVAEKYGSHRVSQIITYGTMAAKAVVRDVGRVMSQPYGFVDRLAKMVPFEVGMTLDKAMKESEDLQKAYKDEEEVREILDLAFSLEGLSRNCGKHAGGVVIAPTALTDFAPLYCEPDGSSLVTQYDKDDAEEVGLVKFDFLGLRTLTIIDNALANIEQQTGERIDLMALPLTDPATYELFQRAETTAVFQLESSGMKRLIERLQPNTFEDIIALVALYRPGPLQSGMVDDFVDRKHGRQALAWPHEDYQLEILKPILEPTYGIILYQEQVMQIAQVMAGYSLGRADILRKAMGKKNPEVMALQRDGFVEGCVKGGIDGELASDIFALVEKFAGYGFNKSHSAAYALLSYQTAWLKAHHAAAFMASVLSADMDNTEKVVTLIEECNSIGLEVIPPDINHSAVRFSVPDDKTVLYGLGAIKGVGESALASVLRERDANGPFADLDELCRRADPGSVNKRVLEALIRSGAADSLGSNRATLLSQLEDAIRGAQQYHRDQDAGQVDLFGLGAPEEAADSAEPSEVRLLPEWSERERLQHEKATLGLYLSGHPINEHLKELEHFTHGRLQALCDKTGSGGGNQPSYRQRGTPVLAAGLIFGSRFRDTPQGKMAFVTLDDRSARVEVVLRGDLLETSSHFLVKDEVLIVDGEMSPDEFNGGYKIRAKEIHDLASARARFARRLVLRLRHDQLRDQGLEALLSTLSDYSSGTTPLCIQYSNGAALAEIRAGHGWRVQPQPELIRSLEQLTDESSVELVY